jgi:hypothetical protein
MEDFKNTLKERLIEKARDWKLPALIDARQPNPSVALTEEEEELVEEKRLRFQEAVKAWTGFNGKLSKRDTINILATVYKYGPRYTAQRIVGQIIKDSGLTPEQWAQSVGSDSADKSPSKVVDAFEGAIAQVFSPHGGSENYVNLRSPGTMEGKVAATPGNSGDYPRAGYTIDKPRTRVAGTGGTGYYDSSAGGIGSRSVGSPTPDRTRGLSDSEAARQTYESPRTGSRPDSYQVGFQSRDASPQYHTYGNHPDSKIPSTPAYPTQDSSAQVKKGFFLKPNTPSSDVINTAERIKKATTTSSAGTGLIKGMLNKEDAEFGARVSSGVLGEENEESEEERREGEEEAENMLRQANYLELQAYHRQQEGGWADAQLLRSKATDLRTKAMAKRTYLIQPNAGRTVGKAGLI